MDRDFNTGYISQFFQWFSSILRYGLNIFCKLIKAKSDKTTQALAIIKQLKWLESLGGKI